MKIPYNLTQRSLLLRLGIAMATITLLGIIGMASSIIIASMTQGSAATIDETGALRMQSYRMASLILVAQRQGTPSSGSVDKAGAVNKASWDAVDQAIATFEHSLHSSNLRAITASRSGNASDNDYRDVAEEWKSQLKPRLAELIARGRLSQQQALQQDLALLNTISAFVTKVDNLVKLLAQQAENRITLLTTILSISLYITLGVVFFTMYVMHSDVLLPLRDLLSCAEKAGKGDFSVRALHTGEDELGRLGHAFNGMADDLTKLYNNLEARVAEKTADLERSNRSLELLYHSISRIYDAPVDKNTYQTLLKDIEQVLGFGHGTTCLIENDSSKAIILASTMDPKQGDANLCKLSNCAECLKSETLSLRSIGKHGEKKILSIPLQDVETRYGVMQIEIPEGHIVEEWQMQLLEALSRHIGIAIGTAHRTEQSRRLSLLEERGVIARELHDSLAQSLSYMKIQVSRLQAVMGQHNFSQDANTILAELREGLNGAYRELRELLTTFRLKIEGNGLVPTLEKTVAEFSSRGNIPISIEAHLAGSQLSANEEINIMQIVREALANVIHHSKASHASVTIEQGEDKSISVIIDDDGVGIGTSQSETHHYGINIMLERALSLGGLFNVQTRAVGGTRVTFHFHPGARRHTHPLQQGTLAS